MFSISEPMAMARDAGTPMRRRAAMLALLALAGTMTSSAIADARGGRTTAADCEAGSDDPDCPDTPKKK